MTMVNIEKNITDINNFMTNVTYMLICPIETNISSM